MTATADFRQMAQYIGLAMCSLIMRTAFGVFGIIWGIVREIVNGVFRVAIGVIVAILSTIVFFGFPENRRLDLAFPSNPGVTFAPRTEMTA